DQVSEYSPHRPPQPAERHSSPAAAAGEPLNSEKAVMRPRSGPAPGSAGYRELIGIPRRLAWAGTGFTPLHSHLPGGKGPHLRPEGRGSGIGGRPQAGTTYF